mgnify:CR=1 FL=1
MMVKIELATPVAKKLKVLIYGPSGSGKTLAALTFPRPLLIDAESGSDLYAGRPGIPQFHRARCKTLTDLEDVIRQVEADNGKTWDTLIIDPLTVFYDVEKTTLSVNNTKDLGYREWAKINNRMGSLYTRLTGLNVHVVVIAREATEYASEGKDLKKVGQKPDADRDLVYMMDFRLRMQPDFSAIVEKSRGATLGKSDHLPRVDWSVFEVIAAAFTDGQRQDYEDDEQAATRQANDLRNREVAEQFVAHWRGQGLTNTDLLSALNVKRLSEYEGGRALADTQVQTYIAQMTSKPAPAKNGATEPEAIGK